MKTLAFKSPGHVDLLKQIIELPAEPYSTPQVLSAVKVLSRIPSEVSEFQVEDADYDFIMARVSATQWTRATADVGAFLDAVNNAT